jgi:hypothetical protein
MKVGGFVSNLFPVSNLSFQLNLNKKLTQQDCYFSITKKLSSFPFHDQKLENNNEFLFDDRRESCGKCASKHFSDG